MKTEEIIALAAAGIAALWVYNQNAERTKMGSAENPVSDAYYVNPVLCALTGKFCYAKNSAGTTDTVPVPAEAWPTNWTEDPTTYWMKAKKAGLSLVEACKARSPNQMMYDLCIQAGMP